jgi:hypothetical protein
MAGSLGGEAAASFLKRLYKGMSMLKIMINVNTSAPGKEAQTPFSPKNLGKMMVRGMIKINGREMAIIKDSTALPMDGKTIWPTLKKPKSGMVLKMILVALTAVPISVSSLVKTLSTGSGKKKSTINDAILNMVE